MEIGAVSIKNRKEKIYLSLFRGSLIFMATYGLIGSYLSGFSIYYDETLVMVVIGILSCYMGFLSYNKWTENIGYIILLTGFTATAFRMRIYIESGFSGMLNKTIEVIGQIYDESITRMFRESLEDRYTAVTICAIFLSIFMGILFNIVIVRYMNLLGTIAMLLPGIGMVFFFNRNVEKKYIFMIAFVIAMVAILQRGENYKIRGAIISKLRKKHKNKIKIRIGSGSVFLQTGFIMIVIMFLFFAAFQIIYPRENFTTPSDWQAWKEEGDDAIRTILKVGIFSFLEGQYGGGGISGGDLSGAASVTPDYQTDLKVRFVPYTRETMYLRAFIGGNYEGTVWTESVGNETSITEWKKKVEAEYAFAELSPEKMHNKQSNLLKKSYEKQKFMKAKNPFIQTKMYIKNIGASEEYGYFPYYSSIKETDQIHYGMDETVLGTFYQGESYTVPYYPYNEGVKAEGEDRYLEESYAKYVSENYLQIPENNKPVLSAICNSLGRYGTAQDKIKRVTEYITTECHYSKKPGAVPRGEDFVNYFLEEKKRGFCMHFASAGTLLMREMGIPARYVEGYVIPYSDVVNGEILKDQEYDKWFSGNNPLGKTAVVEVDVDDSMAHAWVEVYRQGFGWVPVEVTPADYEEADDQGFWDNLGKLFRSEEDDNTDNALQIGGLSNGAKKIIIIAVIIIVTSLMIQLFYKMVWGSIIKNVKYQKLRKKQQYNKMIQYEYYEFCKYLAHFMKNKAFVYKEPREVFLALKENKQQLKNENSEMEIESIIPLVEKALYSQYVLTQEEYEQCKGVFVKMYKKYSKKKQWKRK